MLSRAKSNTLGFTLIELIIVIVILGILAVTAAPKFLNLSGDAKASTIKAVGAALDTSLKQIFAKAVIEGQSKGVGQITINGTVYDLYFGYPRVDGSASFVTINNLVNSWIDIDAVDRNTADADRDAAPFFTDKASADNQIFIFFSSDYATKGVDFACQVRYQNPEGGANPSPEVRVLTDAC